MVDAVLASGLRVVFDLSPQLKHRWPSFRMCLEENRLAVAALSWPPADFPAPPPVAFAFEGLQEIRLQSCPALRTLPPEIGLCKSITSLVLLSNSLVELPPEVGDLWRLEQLFVNGNFLRTLPEKVGALPSLSDFCADANLLESLPPFTSKKMTLFTAPGNSLRTLPAIAGKPTRVELHGNSLVDISFGQQAWWSSLGVLKLMGNDIRTLPQSLASLHSLRLLGVAGNRLQTLPRCVAELGRLETVLAYNNEIRTLPDGLLRGSRNLKTVLLEGNPIEGDSIASLIADAEWTRANTVALDTSQVCDYTAFATARGLGTRNLPMCISVGDLIDAGGPCKYYLKLVRASQLRREPGALATGLPGGPPSPRSAPAKLLLVAFAASQGEPEWMGALRRLFTATPPLALPPPTGELSDFLGAGSEPDAQLAALWANCAGSAVASPSEDQEPLSLPGAEDVDLLSVVDHRMRWYSEDAPALDAALEAIVAQHERSIFVGASMGGFGALRHGGRLADAVLAFGPQSRLDTAILRPPAGSAADLGELADLVCQGVRLGRERGAQLEVHCAADEHLWHALNLPLADGALTVHPLMPRKPFARLLDSASLLEPIVADAVYRAMQRPMAARADDVLASKERAQEEGAASPRLLVARWGGGGALTRYRSTRQEVLHRLFGPDAPSMPRPGDWFCPRCLKRNQMKQFFCRACGSGVEGANITTKDAIRVPGAAAYPQPGDWGCGACGTGMASYDAACTKCNRSKGDHPQTLVAAA